jgi:hypothetical protein
MRHVRTVRVAGSDGREYTLHSFEPTSAERATPGDRDDRPGLSVLETSEGLEVRVGANGELTVVSTGVTLALAERRTAAPV